MAGILMSEAMSIEDIVGEIGEVGHPRQNPESGQAGNQE